MKNAVTVINRLWRPVIYAQAAFAIVINCFGHDTQENYSQAQSLLLQYLHSWSEGTVLAPLRGTEEDVELELILAPLAYARIASTQTYL